MRIYWECTWCQYKIFVLAQASQYYRNTPTALQNLHVCPLGMCLVLVPNIGLKITISNTTQISPQHFINFMCVHWECAWCYCQILVLAPAYPTLNKYAHRISETSCVSTGNVRGASAKYWYQHQRIQYYTYTPTELQKLHVCPLGMCVVLVPNIGLRTTISTTTLFAHSTSETSCVSTGNVCGASAKYWYQHKHIQYYTNTPTALQNLHVCPLGMCVVLVQNIGLRTTISNTTLIRPQHFRNLMCIHLHCVWFYCQIFVLAQAYPILHKYAHSTSESSCVSTGNVRGASTKYWSQNHHIQNYTNTPTALQKLDVYPLTMCVVLLQILVLAPPYSTLHKYPHNTSLTSCVSTGNVRGASTKYLYQQKHIQYYTNTPTALQNLHVCPLVMCVVLVPNIGLRTTTSNTTLIRPQNFRNFICIHLQCA